MSYNINGNYSNNKIIEPFTYDLNNCVDNPYYRCSMFADTYYKCYSDNYNNKYKNCCNTCQNVTCIDTNSNCKAIANAGLCNSGDNQEEVWNQCCNTCRLTTNLLYTPSLTPSLTPTLTSSLTPSLTPPSSQSYPKPLSQQSIKIDKLKSLLDIFIIEFKNQYGPELNIIIFSQLLAQFLIKILRLNLDTLNLLNKNINNFLNQKNLKLNITNLVPLLTPFLYESLIKSLKK